MITGIRCPKEEVNDIVVESIIKAWFQGKNFIEYCLPYNGKAYVCILAHLVWYGGINDFTIKNIIYSIKLHKDYKVTKKLFNLLKDSILIVKEKDFVSFYMKNIDKRILHELISDKKAFSCTNIFYTLYEDIDIVYEEEY